MADGELHKLEVAEGGERVDRYVAGALTDLSRSAVQRLIDAGDVTVNGEEVQSSYKLRPGDVVTVRIPPPEPTDLQPEAIPLEILYEDDHILAINKPPELVVHPGAGNPSGTLVNAVLAHCPDVLDVGGERRPGIVHRLDKDTSGVIVVAKNDAALRTLQRQFRHRTVKKIYVALVIGNLPQASGLIEAPIGRHRRHRKKMAVTAGGKMARTRWEVAGRYEDAEGRVYTLLDVRILTGRTHQIRVHFAWMNYPLVGDDVYGPAHPVLQAPRQFLHARDLTVEHPATGEEMTFSAPLPADLRDVLEQLRREE